MKEGGREEEEDIDGSRAETATGDRESESARAASGSSFAVCQRLHSMPCGTGKRWSRRYWSARPDVIPVATRAALSLSLSLSL